MHMNNAIVHMAGRVYSHFGATNHTSGLTYAFICLYMACRVVSDTDVPVHVADAGHSLL